MKQSMAKQAQQLHEKNRAEIRRLLEMYDDPATPPDEKVKLKEKFRKILDHVDKIQAQKSESLFMKMFTKVNGKVD